MAHPAAESKAVRKVNPSYQEITIADGETEPAAGVYIKREHMDLVGIETDAEFDGSKITWYGARTKALADAGTWVDMNWGGSAKETTIAASSSSGEDPLHFAMYRFLRPVSDAAQDGADTVIGVICRDFTRV